MEPGAEDTASVAPTEVQFVNNYVDASDTSSIKPGNKPHIQKLGTLASKMDSGWESNHKYLAVHQIDDTSSNGTTFMRKDPSQSDNQSHRPRQIIDDTSSYNGTVMDHME